MEDNEGNSGMKTTAHMKACKFRGHLPDPSFGC